MTTTTSPTTVTTSFPSPGQANQPLHLQNIVVPLDFSEMSLASLRYAVPLARQFGAKITLLHVVQPPHYAPEVPYPAVIDQENLSMAENTLSAIRTEKIDSDLHVDTVVQHGFVFDKILEVARKVRADLIVTTTHGYSGLKHLLMGSTAECIVRKAPCPVLVVRDPEAEPK
jgi:nucleotide-binding universal stress UspA family protein